MSRHYRDAILARRTIVETVSAAFLPVEQSAQATIAHGAHCLSVLIEQRGKAMLPPHVGAEALSMIATATHLATEAHMNLAAAHRLLSDIPADMGLPMAIGPDCAPNKAFESARLQSVA
jgi:hypothetical protein